MKAPTQIFNLVEDVKVLAKAVKKLKFVYCNRSVNRLADRITKQIHQCTP